MSERSTALRQIWTEVNRIACDTEDTQRIRNLIAEAGIAPEVHVGIHPDDFSTDMKAEWMLGQWADMIDHGSPFLNSCRNASLANFDRAYGVTS